MSWNYRIVRQVHAAIAEGVEPEEWFHITEVYYHKDGTIRAWAVTGSPVAGESLDELRNDFALMALALDRPVLDEAELEAARAAKLEVQPDTSDIHEAGEEWFKKARLVRPPEVEP